MIDRDAPPDAALETYLARLDVALADLPAGERREILLETRSHVAEQTLRSPSRGAEDVLAELGAPDAYARQFLRDQDASPPGPRPDTLRGIARLATGGWTTFPLLLVTVAAYSIAFFALVIALWKLVEPNATGLFVGEVAGKRTVAFVVSDPHQPGREVLGYSLVPLGLLIALGIHLAMSAVLRRLPRRHAEQD